MDWTTLREKWMSDPDFRDEWEALEPAFEIHRWLLRVRAARGWAQPQLARRLGVSQSYVAKVEAGRQNITLAQLGRWARALNCRLRVTLELKDGQSTPAPGASDSEIAMEFDAPVAGVAACIGFTPLREGC